ncbi:amidohydrolase family protein [Methylobrevis albus]|uniref:Amidohydrolase family protein n=1 Tax=Methylobrevis albus TaxID=2793297 RepID=A0A931I2V4_9HYPH|nr:amidohydrolase family protein [Methylobrevis albus]MBH0238444.1 amidohydrolase family protein [Methylobrevis albus]
MSIDFVLRSAALPGQPGLSDIAVAAGRIAGIAPSAAGAFVCDAPTEDAGGRLATAGLVETHIHLDKAGIIGRCRICAGTLAEAVAETSKAKAAFTVDDVYARAAAIVEKAILHGTTRLRSFVEIDPRAGFRSFEALQAVKRHYAGLIEIKLCAFAQEGLTNDPGTEAMLDAALADGADLVGGCPYTDSDPTDHIRRIFDLAEKYDVDADFHLDFDLDPAGSNLPAVLAETGTRGWGGRVSVGHVTKLSALAPAEFEATGRRLAEAGVGITVLPATDLFLTGRAADRLVPRGVTPAHRLLELGAQASISTNNVLNPFTPFGDVALMRMANLYANVAQVGTDAGLAAVFGMVSDGAARLGGFEGYGLAEGAIADIVLFDAASAPAAVAEVASALKGWKAGRPSFERPPARLLGQATG